MSKHSEAPRTEADARLIADLLEMVGELYAAMKLYELEQDEPPPFKHRKMMERANALLRATRGEAT